MMNDLNLESKPIYFYHGLDVQDFRRIDNEEEIKEINERGYDIFWCLQQFKDNRRIKDNLEFFKWVGADFDDITWGELQQRLENFPKPTMAVRTRSGVHCYWKLKTKIKGTEEFWQAYREFIAGALVPIGADTNARDVCRVLRAPMYRYWQDSENNRYENEEIRIEVIYDDGQEWEWDQLKRLFNFKRNHKTTEPVEQRISPSSGGSGFWRNANEVAVLGGLQKLSGTSYVGGERYTFRKDSNITRIIINGKDSNAWIDKAGRIGSQHRNGEIPIAGTLFNWLMFPSYGHTKNDVAKIFKEFFNVNDT